MAQFNQGKPTREQMTKENMKLQKKVFDSPPASEFEVKIPESFSKKPSSSCSPIKGCSSSSSVSDIQDPKIVNQNWPTVSKKTMLERYPFLKQMEADFVQMNQQPPMNSDGGFERLTRLTKETMGKKIVPRLKYLKVDVYEANNAWSQHFLREETSLFIHLPPPIMQQLVQEHAALRANGYANDEVKAHLERETLLLKAYLPASLAATVEEEHRHLLATMVDSRETPLTATSNQTCGCSTKSASLNTEDCPKPPPPKPSEKCQNSCCCCCHSQSTPNPMPMSPMYGGTLASVSNPPTYPYNPPPSIVPSYTATGVLLSPGPTYWGSSPSSTPAPMMYNKECGCHSCCCCCCCPEKKEPTKPCDNIASNGSGYTPPTGPGLPFGGPVGTLPPPVTSTPPPPASPPFSGGGTGGGSGSATPTETSDPSLKFKSLREAFRALAVEMGTRGANNEALLEIIDDPNTQFYEMDENYYWPSYTLDPRTSYLHGVTISEENGEPKLFFYLTKDSATQLKEGVFYKEIEEFCRPYQVVYGLSGPPRTTYIPSEMKEIVGAVYFQKSYNAYLFVPMLIQALALKQCLTCQENFGLGAKLSDTVFQYRAIAVLYEILEWKLRVKDIKYVPFEKNPYTTEFIDLWVTYFNSELEKMLTEIKGYAGGQICGDILGLIESEQKIQPIAQYLEQPKNFNNLILNQKLSANILKEKLEGVAKQQGYSLFQEAPKNKPFQFGLKEEEFRPLFTKLIEKFYDWEILDKNSSKESKLENLGLLFPARFGIFDEENSFNFPLQGDKSYTVLETAYLTPIPDENIIIIEGLTIPTIEIPIPWPIGQKQGKFYPLSEGETKQKWIEKFPQFFEIRKSTKEILPDFFLQSLTFLCKFPLPAIIVTRKAYNIFFKGLNNWFENPLASKEKLPPELENKNSYWIRGESESVSALQTYGEIPEATKELKRCAQYRQIYDYYDIWNTSGFRTPKEILNPRCNLSYPKKEVITIIHEMIHYYLNEFYLNSNVSNKKEDYLAFLKSNKFPDLEILVRTITDIVRLKIIINENPNAPSDLKNDWKTCLQKFQYLINTIPSWQVVSEAIQRTSLLKAPS